MIKELIINNLAIIKDIEMDFNTKFSTITGETGAGKSIILDGIALITGKRANVSSIRKDEDLLKVQAVIEISEELKNRISKIVDDIDLEDNELIIYRQISKDAKSKISINGKRVTLNVLSNIMELVVDIVGQHENQYLLKKIYHQDLLDAFLDIKKYELKASVSKIREINRQISEVEEEKKQIIEKKDFYKFSIKEIEAANLYENQDEELEEKYKLAFNQGRINEGLTNLQIELDEYMLPSLKRALRGLQYIQEYSNISEIYGKLEEAREILNEVNNDIEISDEEYNIDELSERIDKINNLKKKYGSTIKEILEYKNKLENSLDKLEYSSDFIEELKNKKEMYIKEYIEKAENLSKERKAFAIKLEKEINQELRELNMKEASFKVLFNKKEGFYEKGVDDIEFLIKTNKGQDYQKLAKIASGGEMSRIMLALKVVFSKVDKLETLIFDEIDAGISGETVKLVANKMKKLAKNVQIICVTHSPNIAASSKEQFLIYKENEKDKTLTKIKKLNEEERIKEIARIISGNNISKALEEHVKEMMKDND